MGKNNIIFLILFVIIVSTLINVLFLQNKKITENPKYKRFFRVSLIAGLIVFTFVLITYLILI